MSVKLITYNESLVTPIHDALIANAALLNNGVFFGCEATKLDANKIRISNGIGMIYGREFEVEAEEITIPLATSGTLEGMVYLHMDLANISEPLKIMTTTDSSFELVDNPLVNEQNGVSDLQLCYFEVGTTELIEVVPQVSQIYKLVLADENNAGLMPSGLLPRLANVEEGATKTYVKGNAETNYRKGYVNLTPREIGAVDKTGDTMTGDLTLEKRIKLLTKDKVNTSYPLIYDNNSNLWIGAEQASAHHHVGGTYISTGYDANNSSGYESIKVSVPNGANNSATNYDVWHKGNLVNATTSKAGLMSNTDKSALNAAYANASNNSTLNIQTTLCSGYLSNNGKSINFMIPYNITGGSARVNSLSVIIRIPTGGFPYIKGQNGYTQLGSDYVSIWANNASTRVGEVSSVSGYVKPRSGILVNVALVDKAYTNNSGTALTNNIPLVINVTANISIT